MIEPRTLHAFFEEVDKLAASRAAMRIAQSRKGRRPMRVSTMLKKEKDGTLFKYKNASVYSDQSTLHFQEVDPDNSTLRPSPLKKKKGVVPSRDDVEQPPDSEERQNVRISGVADGGKFNPAEGFSTY